MCFLAKVFSLKKQHTQRPAQGQTSSSIKTTQRVFKATLSLGLLLSLNISGTHFASALELTTLPPEETGQLFRVHGSNTLGARMVPSLLKEYLIAKGLHNVSIQPQSIENEMRVLGYHQNNTSQMVYIDVAAHGSSTGYRSLDQAQADLAMSSRPIKDKEVNQLERFGDMLSAQAEHVIAIDGLAVIVHPRNPISRLDKPQIKAIFSGEITNWKTLGGQDIPISLYARDNNSGTWDTFKSLVLGKKTPLAAGTQRFESNDELSDQVSTNLSGIGFVGLASVRQAKAISVGVAGSTPLAPEHLYVATEDYPLSRRLFLYQPPKVKSRWVTEFIEFAQSAKGQAVVETIGFVSQDPVSIQPEDDRQGPQDYLKLTEGAKRLSVNFRFKAGSAELDNKAKQDIERLARYAKESGQEQEILLVGFGDPKQTETRSIVLSKLRAISVKAALNSEGIATAPVSGFGAYLPVAGAHTVADKLKNQRVEVWLK